MSQVSVSNSSRNVDRAVDRVFHPGTMRAPMPQYYTLLDYRRIERVPRPLSLSPPQESIPAITFSVNDWPGVRVRDILKATVIVDGDQDMVLEQHGWRSTVVNLKWPGYELKVCTDSMRARINVIPEGRYITRQHLAREVCGLLFDSHKIISRHPIAAGLEKWALTTGPEGIRVTDVVLLSMHYYQSYWVPELYVIE